MAPLDPPERTVKDMWIMTGIADAFGVAAGTVQSYWRNRTLRGLREHLAAHGHPDAATALGQPLESLDAGTWHAKRRELGLPEFRLPRGALPIPDLVAGNKPMWRDATIQSWATATKRRRPDGTFGKVKPPGRPPGLREAQPRPRRRRDAATPEAGNVAGQVAAA